MTLEVLHPITTRVQPTTWELREAHSVFVAAERVEREFPSRTTGLACDAAFKALVGLCVKLDERCIGYPSGVLVWAENHLRDAGGI